MQWAQIEDAEWRGGNCRMVKYINFHPRTAKEPLATVYGLQPFTRNFLMRARTQLRIDTDMAVTLQVHSSDGFQLDIHEIGAYASGAAGDVFYDDYAVVLKLAHPQPLSSCERHVSSTVALQKGKIYLVDARYWQGDGIKCFKACPCCFGASCLTLWVAAMPQLRLHRRTELL